VCPTLADLAAALGHPPGQVAEPAALVDAQGDLAFARLEGALATRPERLAVGEAATVDALRSALAGDLGLLLSVHGDFDELNPWRSAIRCADGRLELADLVAGRTRLGRQVVILGVCEAGKSRRSISDEPFGFPTLLLHAGAPLVAAPAWKVDDFASFLFLTRLFAELAAGAGPAEAVGATGTWLAQLSAVEALARIDALLGRLPVEDMRLQHARATSAPQIDAACRWLQSLPQNERAFRNPLDWAAFQASGCPIVARTIGNQGAAP
jgi:CHAT domain-containing protein